MLDLCYGGGHGGCRFLRSAVEAANGLRVTPDPKSKPQTQTPNPNPNPSRTQTQTPNPNPDPALIDQGFVTIKNDSNPFVKGVGAAVALHVQDTARHEHYPPIAHR